MEKKDVLRILDSINQKLKPKVAEAKKKAKEGDHYYMQAFAGNAFALADLQNAIAEVIVEELKND